MAAHLPVLVGAGQSIPSLLSTAHRQAPYARAAGEATRRTGNRDRAWGGATRRAAERLDSARCTHRGRRGPWRTQPAHKLPRQPPGPRPGRRRLGAARPGRALSAGRPRPSSRTALPQRPALRPAAACPVLKPPLNRDIHQAGMKGADQASLLQRGDREGRMKRSTSAGGLKRAHTPRAGGGDSHRPGPGWRRRRGRRRR